MNKEPLKGRRNKRIRGGGGWRDALRYWHITN
jgi:hypothetical protein